MSSIYAVAPSGLRPREKLTARGPEGLSDLELLQLLLGSGCRQVPVEVLAARCRDALDRHGAGLGLDALEGIAGLGPAKSAQLAAALELARRFGRPPHLRVTGPADLLPRLLHWTDRPQEVFLTVLLNGAQEVLAVRPVTVGLLNRTLDRSRVSCILFQLGEGPMVAVYCRVSAVRQVRKNAQGGNDEGSSLAEQERRGIAYAASVGKPYKVYTEQASGKTANNRDEFLELLTDIQTGEVDTLWVRDIDRSSRRVSDGAAFLDLLRERGIRVIEGSKGNREKNLDDGDQVMMTNLQYVFAQREREKIVERTRDGKRAEKDAGKRAYCYVYGYDSSDGIGRKTWSINPVEAEVVRGVFRMYVLQDYSLTQVLEALAAQNVRGKLYGRAKKGKSLHNGIEISTVKKILGRPEYLGLTPNTDGELIPSQIYPPILEDAELWHRAQDKLRRPSSPQQKFFKSSSRLLTGLINCAACGAPYYAHIQPSGKARKLIHSYGHKTGTPPFNRCEVRPKYLRREVMDLVVEGVFRRLFLDKERILALVRAAQSNLLMSRESLLSEVVRAEDTLRDVESRRAELLRGVQEGLYELSEIRENLLVLKANEERLRTELESKRKRLTIEEAGVEEALRVYTSDILGRFDRAGELARREILLQVLRIVLSPGRIELKFVGGYTLLLETEDLPWIAKYFEGEMKVTGRNNLDVQQVQERRTDEQEVDYAQIAWTMRLLDRQRRIAKGEKPRRISSQVLPRSTIADISNLGPTGV